MAASDQEILDAARDRLKAILTGGVAEYYEQNDRVRLLEIDRLEKLIANYEQRVNSGSRSVFAPFSPTRV